jgi:hypothetical protein
MRPRAVGSVIFLMSAAVLIVAAGLSTWYHLGLPGQIGASALTLPGLVMAWLAYQAAYVVPTLAEATDQLAGALQAQWKTELRVRWLDGPVQLLVSWSPPPEDLTAGLPDGSRNEGVMALVGSREHRLRAGRLGRHGNDLDELRQLAAGLRPGERLILSCRTEEYRDAR